MTIHIKSEEVPKNIVIELVRGKSDPENIYLAVLDEHGDVEWKGYLLKFCVNGKITRIAGIPDSFGFPLDDKGRLIIED